MIKRKKSACPLLMLFAIGKFGAAKDMITSRIPLDHLVEKGIEELLTNKDRQIKIVVTPKHS